MRVNTCVLGSALTLGLVPMDATLTDRNGLNYFGKPPVIIAGSSDAALERAFRTVEASGLRVGDQLAIAAAQDRIERQVAAAALWVEIDEDCGGPMDELLARVNRDVADGRYAAVVSTLGGFLDAVAARVSDGEVGLIVDADDAERAAALAIAVAYAAGPRRLSDVASDQNATRLRQLSEEVGRIATTLARLSTGPQAGPRRIEPAPAADAPEISVETVRSVIRARRLRARFFDEALFADPAWDMLLDLLQAEISHLRVPVSSLCIAAAVPATTALRWLKTLVQQGVFVRRADPHDGRRVFVELAPEASHALRRYFADVGPVAVI
jgi:DNA-binding MarR family transcriptional regulator